MDGADPLDDFLVCHERIPSSASIAPGAETSKWRIIAFLGRGGTAEVDSRRLLVLLIFLP